MARVETKRLLQLIVGAIFVSVPILSFIFPTNIVTPFTPAKSRLQLAEEGDASAQFSLALDYQIPRGIPQDKAQALRWYTASAEQGFAKAQNNLGNMYYDGDGVARDLQKAKYWYEKSALQNQSDGMHNYARFLRLEEKNDQEAMQWYLKAVEAGRADSMTDIGLMYNNGGNGIKQDYATSMEWYLKAAERGDAMAENNIGAMYHNGEGVPKDYAKAREWYEKAAAKGVALAQRNLGNLYFHGNGAPVDFAKARELYTKAAHQNEPKALAALAYMEYAGLAGAVNLAEAVRNYEKAADNGNVDAMQTLAWFYKNGKGTAQDDARAETWYLKAFEEAKRRYTDDKTDKDMITIIADAYYYGQGTDKNPSAAMPYYEEAAALGSSDAEYMIGLAYFEGEGGYERNYYKGMEWMRKAAEHGDIQAYRYIAYAYCAGKGVERDTEQSRHWLEQSAAKGDPVAKEMLENRTQAALLSVLIDAVASSSPITRFLLP